MAAGCRWHERVAVRVQTRERVAQLRAALIEIATHARHRHHPLAGRVNLDLGFATASSAQGIARRQRRRRILLDRRYLFDEFSNTTRVGASAVREKTVCVPAEIGGSAFAALFRRNV